MKRGITLVTLSAMIVILIIITTTVVFSGSSVINNSKKMKFASELLFMKEAVQNYSNLNEGNLPIKDIAITSPNLPSGSYKEIDMQLLGMIDTIYGRKLKSDNEDIYVLSSSNEVYYLKGLKIGSKTYYFLDDELKEIINYEDNTKVLKRDGIIFSKSTEAYTNQSIKTTIQIPDSYTDISVIKKNIAVSESNSIQGYKVYEVNEKDNYNVYVSYKKNGKQSSQSYNVSNYDNVAPEISVTSTDTIVDDENSQNSVTIQVDDNLSGVKKIMYEIGSVEKSYFESDNKGTIVTSNNIIIDKNINKITIYAIDNAGNSNIKVQNLNTSTSIDDYVKYGLLLHYDGINNTGNGHSNSTTVWKDLSGHGNDGTLKNFRDNELSKWLDNGLLFDGINDWVNISEINYPNITLQVVVEYNEKPQAEQCVLVNYENGGYGISIDSKSYTKFQVRINENNSYQWINNGVVSELNKKMFFSGTYDGSRLAINKDDKVSEKIVSGTIKYPNNVKMVLGANPGINDNVTRGYLKGKIYSVRIYNRALTEDETKHNYNIDKARFGI